MINQVQNDCMHFPVLDTQNECRERNENFISLGCLIHVSPLISHVREWMSVCFVKRLKFKVSTILCNASIYSIWKAIDCSKNFLST